MNRRDFLALAGASTALVPWAARARTPLNFDAAARYSAQRNGLSILVMQSGALLFEDYPSAGASSRAWETASGTKSFCGVLAAAAAGDGLLSLDERCAATLDEWSNDARTEITLRQLLTLTGGLPSGQLGRPPTYAQSVSTAVRDAPGTRFQYGNPPFQVFGEIMRRKLRAAGRDGDPVAYLRARVLDPIGVTVDRWRRGTDDLPLLPQGAALTARNWARFGQWVLDGGKGVHAATLAACFEGTTANPGYGLTWWLLRPGLVPPGSRTDLDVAVQAFGEGEDIVMAAGAGNQRLYLLRRRGLVVVRQASGILEAMAGRGPVWRDADFLRALLGESSF